MNYFWYLKCSLNFFEEMCLQQIHSVFQLLTATFHDFYGHACRFLFVKMQICYRLYISTYKERSTLDSILLKIPLDGVYKKLNITYGKILWPNGNISHKSQYDFLLSILSCKLDIWWVFWGNDPWNVWSKGDDKHFENLSKSWHRDCTWFVVLWGFLYLQSTLDRFLDVAWYLKDSTSEFFVSTSDNVWRKSLLYNCATAVVLLRTSFFKGVKDESCIRMKHLH